MERTIRAGEIFRYTKPNAEDHLSHPYRNFWAVQSGSLPLAMLESGINGVREVKGPDGVRMPLLALRSSPDKAGSMLTPWEDTFDFDGGKVRYYGDHRVEKNGRLGETTGDVRLETAWRYHRATSPEIRVAAPPILVFRTVTGHTASGPRGKGFVEFVGLAVMTDLRPIEQRDPLTSKHFLNYVTDLTLLDLGEDGLHWDWLDARRDPSLTSEDGLAHAPEAWRAWVRWGLSALPSRTQVREDPPQGPTPIDTPTLDTDSSTTADDDTLTFPWLAARAVEHLLGIGRTRMMTGPERDGTVMFRGTHRLGSATASVSLRVVAVAGLEGKAVLDAASSLLTELEPGQIGVVVTPSLLTEADIRSLKKPGTPLLVLAGDAFRAQVLQIAEQSFAGDLTRLEGATPRHLSWPGELHG